MLSFKKICLLLILLAMVATPMELLAASCDKIQQDIVTLDKEQMSLKNSSQTKSLSEIQIEYDKAAAEMLFFHGLLKAKQEYQALLEGYAQQEQDLHKSVDDLKNEVKAIGNVIILQDLLGDFSALLKLDRVPLVEHGELFFNEIKQQCLAGRQNGICSLLADNADNIVENKKNENLIRNFFNYHRRLYPIGTKNGQQKAMGAEDFAKVSGLFNAGLPPTENTFENYARLKLLIEGLEGLNIRNLAQAFAKDPPQNKTTKDQGSADTAVISGKEKLLAQNQLRELKYKYEKFFASIGAGNYFSADKTKKELMQHHWQESRMLSALANLQDLQQQKKNYSMAIEIGDGFDQQLTQINRRLNYALERQQKKSLKQKSTSEQQSFLKLYNALTVKNTGCKKISKNMNKGDKAAIDDCIKNHLSENQLRDKYYRAKELLRSKAAEILAIKGQENDGLSGLLTPTTEYQKLDRIKHIFVGQYQRFCIPSDQSEGPLICKNSISHHQDIDAANQPFNTLVTASGEILSSLKLNLVSAYAQETPEQQEKIKQILKDACKADLNLTGCAKIAKSENRKKFFENHYIDPNERWVDSKKTLPNYKEITPWWKHGVLYAAKTFSNLQDPTSPANVFLAGKNNELNMDFQKYNAIGFKQGEHSANQYRDWQAEQMGYLPDGLGGYYRADTLLAGESGNDAYSGSTFYFDQGNPFTTYNFADPFASPLANPPTTI